jgi:hypothetical protein
MWLFMFVWGAALVVQVFTGGAAYRRLPPDVGDGQDLRRRCGIIPFFLAGVGGSASPLAWLAIVGMYALERLPDCEIWYSVVDITTLVVTLSQAIGVLLAVIAICLSLAAPRDHSSILLFESVVLVNLLLPNAVMFFRAATAVG